MERVPSLRRVFVHVRGNAPRVVAAIVVVGLIVWGMREWFLFHERKQTRR